MDLRSLIPPLLRWNAELHEPSHLENGSERKIGSFDRKIGNSDFFPPLKSGMCKFCTLLLESISN